MRATRASSMAGFDPAEQLRLLLTIEAEVRAGKPVERCLRDLAISAPTYRAWKRDHGGQRFDPLTGEIQPWYTHLALDEIQEWDLSDKVVLEWGGGCSTLWWARRCQEVYTVEADRRWCEWISGELRASGLDNTTVVHRPMTVPPEEFVAIPAGCTPQIAIIDGPRRLACLTTALTLQRPLSVIFDNWQQDGAFVDRAAALLMKRFPGISYPQLAAYPSQHRPWQTAIWNLT